MPWWLTTISISTLHLQFSALLNRFLCLWTNYLFYDSMFCALLLRLIYFFCFFLFWNTPSLGFFFAKLHIGPDFKRSNLWPFTVDRWAIRMPLGVAPRTRGFEASSQNFGSPPTRRLRYRFDSVCLFFFSSVKCRKLCVWKEGRVWIYESFVSVVWWNCFLVVPNFWSC